MWGVLLLIGLPALAATAHRGQPVRTRYRIAPCVILAALILFSPPSAFAQEATGSSPALDMFQRVVRDPTTYAPAVLSYEAHHLDWKSSQVFFQHGFLERSPEFTISGRPDDTPISYEAGNRKIIATALVGLGTSLINNVTLAVVERVLIERHPDRRKLIRTLGWIERVAFASYVSYHESAVHFRQWRKNEQLARQLGYK